MTLGVLVALDDLLVRHLDEGIAIAYLAVFTTWCMRSPWRPLGAYRGAASDHQAHRVDVGLVQSEEAKMADGDEIDIDRFQRTANSLRRLCETIGLERRPRHVEDIVAYARRVHAERAAASATDVEGDSDD